MKTGFKILIGLLISIPITASAILFGDVMTNTNMSVPKVYKYNAGSAPGLSDFPIEFIGSATTNSSGVATIQLTTDGTSGGSALFSSVRSIQVSAGNNTSTLTDVPLASVKSFDGKTLTVNVVNSAAILLGGQGLEFAGSGITVYVTVVGE